MKNTLHLFKVYSSIVGSAFLLTLVFGVPVSAQAATYAYVNTSGMLAYIEASSSDDALNRAINRDPDSGVMLVTGTVVTTTEPVQLMGYIYVNTSGRVVHISAATAAEAFAMAQNIAPNSGVMWVDTASDAELVGGHVAGA